MPRCDFNNPRLTCPVCGYRARRLPTYRECRPVVAKEWKPVMVGDVVERWLTAFGVTKERVERLTRTSGKPGGCGCAARKKWMNEYWADKQRKLRAALLSARRFYVGS